MSQSQPIWKCRSRTLELGRRTQVMGIVNMTPDSFSDGGLYPDAARAVEWGLRLLESGADILDLGAESTRPGAESVSAHEELRRLKPALEILRRETEAPISIDTSKADVARELLDLGADIVNDVTALQGDPKMAEVCARSGAGVVLMHMLGTPRTMQDQPVYKNAVTEIRDYLAGRVEAAVQAGIERDSIVVDPGIGFGKTLEHNLEILAAAGVFASIRPVLIGPSRKSFIGKILDLPVHDRLEGTAAAVAAGVMNGASIVRVHDAKEIRRVVDIIDAIRAAAP